MYVSTLTRRNIKLFCNTIEDWSKIIIRDERYKLNRILRRFSVASKVGKIRNDIWQKFVESDDLNEAKAVLENYPISDRAKQEIVNYLNEHFSDDNPMPSDKRILIETIGPDMAIIHRDFGNKVNQT